MGRLDDKIIIITGGSSGIGKATVELFHKEGAKIVMGDINDNLGKELSAKFGENVEYLHTDVKSESDIKTLINYTVEKYGKLDCIFNNAGTSGVTGLIDEIDTAEFDKTFQILLRGAFLGIKHAAVVMKKQKYGCIISNSSIAGMQTGAGPHVYSSAKAALIHLTKSVATELGEYNIRVNCVCPGFIATPIFGRGANLDQKTSESIAENLKKISFDFQPNKRIGLAHEVANAVLWLASDESSFVNGHALVVDGGFTTGNTVGWFRQMMIDSIIKAAPEELKKQWGIE